MSPLVYGVGHDLDRGEFCVSKLEEEVEVDTELLAGDVEILYRGFRGILADNWFTAGVLRMWEAAGAVILLTVNGEDYRKMIEDDKRHD